MKDITIDISTTKGIRQAERVQAQMYNQFENVMVLDAGINKVRITGCNDAIYENTWCRIIFSTGYVLQSKTGKYNDQYFTTLSDAYKAIGINY